VLLVVAGLLVAMAGGAVASTSTWTVVAGPNPSPADNTLDAVAVVSAADAWAVGHSQDAGGTDQTLIAHWNGGAWHQVASPNPSPAGNQLHGVAAVSATSAWAVGATAASQPLVERWDGASWRVVPAPAPPGGAVLSDVVALSTTNAWAVGHTGDWSGTVVEHWDGSGWALVASPSPGSGYNVLSAVTAASPTDVWAVGALQVLDGGYYQTRTLTEHWDGSAWRVVASPNRTGSDSVLEDVVGLSASDVWAVGRSYQAGEAATLTEHWDGRGWSVVASPNPGLSFNDLQGVAALSPSDVWAVGTLANGHYNDPSRPAPPRTLTEHWNGRSWKVVASPNPSTGGDRLNGAAALVPRELWAVGLLQTPSGGTRTLVLHTTQG
jgi:hypothetical protein